MEDGHLSDDPGISNRAELAGFGKSGFAGFNTASDLLRQQQADARQAWSSLIQSSNPFARAKSQSDRVDPLGFLADLHQQGCVCCAIPALLSLC